MDAQVEKLDYVVCKLKNLDEKKNLDEHFHKAKFSIFV